MRSPLAHLCEQWHRPSALRQAGLRTFVGERENRSLATIVWYPASNSVKPPVVSKKGAFQPVIAAADAPIKPHADKFPVVLLSHGSGGTAEKLFWLADYLVENGIVVVAVNHVGNMTGDNSGKGIIEVWKRPKATKEFQNRLDVSKVAAVGHSAGGTTALLLAGARLSPDRFQNPTSNPCSSARGKRWVPRRRRRK